MTARLLSLFATSLLLAACSADANRDDAATDDEGALTAPSSAPRVIPTSIKTSHIGSAGTIRYGEPLTKVLRPSGWGIDVTTLTLRGTPGDVVDIAINGRSSLADPALVVLGPADPVEVSKCATSSSPYLQKWCYDALVRPVVASNEDADATTKNARLRVTLDSDTLTIGVLGVSVFDASVVSVSSGLKPEACVKSTAAPAPASHGSFDRVTLTRECKYPSCGPWRELGRESRNGNDLAVVNAAGGSTSLWLTDDDGPYATFGGGWAGGVRTTRDCTAVTRCWIAAGTVTCEDWQRALVSRRGATAIDSDTCTSQLSGSFDPTTPRFSGVIGEGCVSLGGPVRTTYGAGGVRTETKTFIVKNW